MKTGKELLINDKFFENTVISKGKGEELYNTSPNPILKRYIDDSIEVTGGDAPFIKIVQEAVKDFYNEMR